MYGLTLVIVFLFTACSTGRSALDFENFEDFSEFVDNRTFEIQHDWAQPLRGSMIDLIGNSNYVRFKQDSVRVFLPYFGVRQFGGAYNSEGGIKYHGPLRELEIDRNVENENIVVEFETEEGTENLTFTITMYPNGVARTTVTSNQRDNISYRGDVQELPKEVE